MTMIKELAVYSLAGAACLMVSVNNDRPEPAQSVGLKSAKGGIVVRTIAGSTVYDPAIARYYPGECLVRVEYDEDLIFSDRFSE